MANRRERKEFQKLLDLEKEDEIVSHEIDGIERGDLISLCLVGKTWTDRFFNAKAMMNMMKLVWKPKEGMEATELGKNFSCFNLIIGRISNMCWIISHSSLTETYQCLKK